MEVVADFPANWMIGRLNVGASAVSKSLSAVFSDVVAVFAGVPGLVAGLPRVAAARIAAWAMIIARGMGAVDAFDSVDGEVSSVSDAVSVGAAVVAVDGGTAVFATGVAIALIPRAAGKTAGGTFAASGFAVRIEAERGVVKGAGIAGRVTAGAAGVVVAAGFDRSAQDEAPGLVGGAFSCSCCK
jgi:hypothetical protein